MAEMTNPTKIRPKAKWRARALVKNTGTTAKGGQSGTRYKKKHLRCRQTPGNPQGVCAAIGFKGAKVDVECHCGKHNPNLKADLTRYI